jgi:hypothetical protein
MALALTDSDIAKPVRAAAVGRRQVAQWDRAIRAGGVRVPGGPEGRPMPFCGLVELTPEANWGHAVLDLAVSPDGQRVQATPHAFPPDRDYSSRPSLHRLIVEGVEP